MGQATPIRVRKVVKVERVPPDDVLITYETTNPDGLTVILDMPTVRDGMTMIGAITTFQ